MDILFDCKYGVSGDMLVGSLLDLGASKEKLKSFLKDLDLDKFDIVVSKLNKNGISCTDFDVKLVQENFDHDMDYLYGNKRVDINFSKDRKLKDIEKLVKNCKLSEKYKEIALKIFKIIAEAEAKAHKILTSEVVFHETGAMDSIIDIMSVAFCLEDLKVDKVFAINLVEGYGFVNSRMGKLPIPTPAVKNIADRFDIKLESVNLPYELITPTGIGVLAGVAEFKNVKSTSKKCGYGSGKRNYETLGVLKISVI